jgi:hypothetical protein
MTTTTTVGTSLTTIATLETGYSDRIGLQVTNSGDTAFNAFQLQGSINGTTWVALATDAGGFSTPVMPLRRTIGAPVTLAAGATAQLLIDGGYYKSLRVQASVASSTTTAVTVAWSNR